MIPALSAKNRNFTFTFTPILDMTGRSARQGVSFYCKNSATAYPFLTKIMRQGIRIVKKIMRQGVILKDIFRALLKQRSIYIFAKFVCDRVYFLGQGYKMWRDFPHTPITSLIKYPPPEGLLNILTTRRCACQ